MTLPRDELKEALEATAINASMRAGKNAKVAPELLFAPIMWALEAHIDMLRAALSSPPEARAGDLTEALGVLADAQRMANSRGGDYAALSQHELCEFMAQYDQALSFLEEAEQVTPSSGCVFCDIGLPTERYSDGKLWHPGRHGYAPSEPCARSSAPSLPPSPPDGTVGEMLAKLPDAEMIERARAYMEHATISITSGQGWHCEVSKIAETALRLAAHLRSQAKVGAVEDADDPRHETDYCMCGMHMDDHDIGSGHAPVSVRDHYAKEVEEEKGVHASTAFRVFKKWLDGYAQEERDFSRYADHVLLDNIMTAAQRRAISAALAASPDKGEGR